MQSNNFLNSVTSLFSLQFNDGKISPIQVDSSPNSTDNKTITVQIFYFKKPLRKVNPGEKPGRCESSKRSDKMI